MHEQEFFKRVRHAGGKAYIVGGAVRDKILGRAIHDKDYVVCGLSEDVFARTFNFPQKVGRSFPVYLLDIEDRQCEVAFARREIKSGIGYKGFIVDFAPSTSIEEDLYRRDLTVNAIASDENGNIVDPFGGVEDIQEQTLKAVSDHFSEDPVRALRAARFSAQLGFRIDKDTLTRMRLCAPELKLEPAERKFGELQKALGADKPSIYFRALHNAGLLKQEFPWIYNLIGQTQLPNHHPEGDAFEHTMISVDTTAIYTECLEARFASLVHDIGKGVTQKEILPHHYGHDKAGLALLPEMTQALRLPVSWAKSAELIIREHMRVKLMSNYGKMRDILYEMYKGPLSPEDFVIIIRTDAHGIAPTYIEEHERCFSAMRDAAKETVAHSILKGKELGMQIRSREAEALKSELKKIRNEQALKKQKYFQVDNNI